MGIAHLATIVSVFLAGLIPAGCHKNSPQQKASTAPVATTGQAGGAAATNSILHDLGEINLTNHYETCVRLGGGKDCILSPKLLDDRSVQITFALESKTGAGKIHDLTVAQVITSPGKFVEVALGGFNLTLTPMISQE